MVKGGLIYVRLVGLKSETGGNPWSTEAWYTLNAFGSGEPFSGSTAVAPAPGRLPSDAFTISRIGEEVFFRVEAGAPYVLKVSDARGALAAELRGRASGTHALPLKGLSRGLYAATLQAGGKSLSKAFASF